MAWSKQGPLALLWALGVVYGTIVPGSQSHLCHRGGIHATQTSREPCRCSRAPQGYA